MAQSNPWMLAVWPGMGSVALLAGTYLRDELGASELKVFDPGHHFDINSVDVKQGVLQAPSFPRSALYGWQNPSGRDLLIMVGESQPDSNGFEFCQQLLNAAQEYRVERVFTLAASLAKLGPDETPGIMGAVTHPRLLSVLEGQNIPLMSRGHITGLNGVFLGAASTRDLEGICLLGEIPFYAAPLPIPRTSYALLQALGRIAGIELPLEGLRLKAESSKGTIEAIFRTYEQAAMAASEPVIPQALEEEEEEEEEPVEALSPDALQRIEKLFKEAHTSRDKALELKKELDRWGVFKQYEDRFLDLFKKDDS